MSMSTRRMIPPLVDDPRAIRLTLAQRHTLALLPLALDDHGRAIDDAGRMNGQLWGSLWREHGPDELEADLAALAEAGLLTRYEVGGVRYLQMLDWDAQQVISRRGPSRYPAPPTGTRSAPVGGERAGGGRAGGGRAGGGSTWPKPPVEGVWESIDGLVDYVAGAAERLSDPSVQSRAVSFLADLAGQFDPAFSERVREQASTWVGSMAYGAGKGWSSEDVVHLKVVKDGDPYDEVPSDDLPPHAQQAESEAAQSGPVETEAAESGTAGDHGVQDSGDNGSPREENL